LSKKFKYVYEQDGFDEEGLRIPDIPVIYLILETRRGRARGPAILDTGFDGGIYPNIHVVRILRGLTPIAVKRLDHPLYGYVECEVYKAKIFLTTPNFTERVSLGEARIYTPTEPEYLSEDVLVGREVLNKLKIELNGRYVFVNPLYSAGGV